MATQMEMAKNRLFSDKGIAAKNVKLFPGSLRELTAEQIAEQINLALSQIEAGEAEEFTFAD